MRVSSSVSKMGDGVTLDGADINWKFTEDVQIPPFRNMDEFILGRARFQV